MEKRKERKMKTQGIASSRPGALCHTFTVYDKFRIVTVRSHEYCFVLYLLLAPFRFSIDDFQQLYHIVLVQHPMLTAVSCPEEGGGAV